VFSSYRRTLQAPGAVPFVLAGLLARFPIGMYSVGAVFMITGAAGSYELAGALSATLLVVLAVAGPQIARLTDRWGQARVAVPAVLTTVTGGFAELLCVHYRGPHWLLFLTAAMTGLAPNTGSMSRARWAVLHQGNEELLHSAYALDTVVDELCFVLGPIAATALATSVFPSAGYLTAQLLLLAGVLLFCAQRRTEPPVTPRTGPQDASGPGGSALRTPALRVLLPTLAAVGSVFGLMEITVIGFADAHHHKPAASLVLSCYALGSMLSGIAFGVWRPKGSPARQLPLFLLLMTGMLSLLSLVRTLPELALGLLLAGLCTAPTLVTAMGLVRDRVPAHQLTEGFSWTTTGVMVGVSLGAAAGGWAVQHLGPGAGFHIQPALSGLAMLIALLGGRALAGPPADARADAEPSEAVGTSAHVQ
jgi:MFS family permease